MTSRYIHITTPGKEKQALDRAARALELQFDYYGPFGFAAILARLDEPMFDLDKKVRRRCCASARSPSTDRSST